MKKFLIVDGSSIFYRAFYAMPSLTAPNGKSTGAVVGFANIILKIFREQSPDLMAIAFDAAKKTFRNEIFSEYKANRPPMPDDLAAQLPLMKEFVDVLGVKSCAAPNYEADDVIGTLAGQACKNFKVVILTGDRDALQLINATTKVLLTKYSTTDLYDEKKFIDEYGFAPAQLVDFKGLRGDASDNIPGVKGIGEVIATKLVKQFGSVENVLANREKLKTKKKVYAALNDFEADALLSKRLATIDCNVPEIFFRAEDFKISPDLTRADRFCGRYAFMALKKKMHELFDRDNLLYRAARKFLSGDEPQPIDFEKIFAAENLTIAQAEMNSFAVKIFGGEIFSAERDDLQKIFNEFGGKIILSGAKNFLRAFDVPALEKIFDVELAAYLLYPEMESYTCEKLLPLEFDGLQLTEDSLAAKAAALEKLSALYEKKLAAADMTRLYDEIELPLTKVLANMEARGVAVNKVLLKKKSAEMAERIAAFRQNIFEQAGETFNINSSQQLADVLFEKLKLPAAKKTKTGYSTNAEVLEELKGRHPIV